MVRICLRAAEAKFHVALDPQFEIPQQLDRRSRRTVQINSLTLTA